MRGSNISILIMMYLNPAMGYARILRWRKKIILGGSVCYSVLLFFIFSNSICPRRYFGIEFIYSLIVRKCLNILAKLQKQEKADDVMIIVRTCVSLDAPHTLLNVYIGENEITQIRHVFHEYQSQAEIHVFFCIFPTGWWFSTKSV